MNQIIKINKEEYPIEHMYDLTDWGVRNGELIELRKGEFFWTKKHFVKSIFGLSKIVPFPDKINMYLLAFRLQFTDIYSRWMKSRILPNNR